MISAIAAILAMRAGYFEGDIVNPPEEYIEGDDMEHGFENQFTKLNIPSSRLITDFDYDSVMLYGSTAFSVDRKSPTMLKKNGGKLEEVYKKDTLSNADYYRIHVLYRPEGY
ncbi:hypothetical protein HPB50_019127 [Hyalomma asiaticum]|uniref:Uncharacterized protein n=1 Tax=Hyalomma asiaticum TaxID=266040 RepID=A0ACB7SH94_HYAAI|nr:hypothetical protein HPB50_019127 [Hyalomma asiaticum]